jgi:hypothetical protein
MAELKTKHNDQDVEAFLNGIGGDNRRWVAGSNLFGPEIVLDWIS